jgi:hypothetical protein
MGLRILTAERMVSMFGSERFEGGRDYIRSANIGTGV